MQLKSLRLCQFRSFQDLCLDFSSEINGLYGKNASGKTTILEAIYFLSSGRSFRTSSLEDLIKEGKQEFHVEAAFVKHGVDHILRVSWSKSQRKIIYNRTESHNFGSLFGLFLSIPLIPEDIDLIKGQPQQRRHYIDLVIAKLDPLYVRHSFRFERAMRQRNALLKAKDFSTIEGFEREMARSSSYIVQKRYEVVAELNQTLFTMYPRFGEKNEKINLKYETRFSLEQTHEEHHFQQFVKDRSKDACLGVTSSGPHRDDLILEINEKKAKLFGSEGQKRSVAASLKLAEYEMMRVSHGVSPILLLDDIGLGFDSLRKKRFFSLIKEPAKDNKTPQIFLSSAEIPEIEEGEKGHFINLEELKR